jgi:hypothetical protein
MNDKWMGDAPFPLYMKENDEEGQFLDLPLSALW